MNLSEVNNITINGHEVVKLSHGSNVIWEQKTQEPEYIQFTEDLDKSKPFRTLRWQIDNTATTHESNIGISTIPNDPASSSTAPAYKWRFYIGSKGNVVAAINGTVKYANPFAGGKNSWNLAKLPNMVVVDSDKKLVEYTYPQDMYYAGLLDGASPEDLKYLWLKNEKL